MSAPAMGAQPACGAELGLIRLETAPFRPADLIMRNFSLSQVASLMKSAACSA